MKRRDRSQGNEFWRKFEEEVEKAVRDLGDAVVQRDVLVPGVLSGRPRQIDVLAKGRVAGHEMTVIFEAKCYQGSVQIGRIDELVGKALDVAAQRAVLYAPNGFSAGAIARAEGTLNSPLTIGTAHLEVDWEEPPPRASDMRRDTGVPDRVLRYENPFSYESVGSEPVSSQSRPKTPADNADYARFFRGEAPLHFTR